MRRACLAELLLICFDNPSQEEKKLLLSKTRPSLEILHSKHQGEALCASFDTNRDVKLVTRSDMLQSLTPRPPLHRLREAVKYIAETLSKTKDKHRLQSMIDYPEYRIKENQRYTSHGKADTQRLIVASIYVQALKTNRQDNKKKTETTRRKPSS